MSGEELLNIIKAEYLQIDVIMITVYPTIDSVVKTLKLGAYDYIIKPIDFNLLIKKINLLLERKRLLSEISTEKELRNKITQLFDDMQDLFISTIETLADVIEAKDAYTFGHCKRIRDLSLSIAKMMHLCETDLHDLEYASLLHDVGKIAIPESILLKPGRLTDAEFEVVKLHTIKGANYSLISNNSEEQY